MQDEEITLFNTCTDLVSLREMEAFPRHLLESKRPGEWICVRDFCRQVGVAPGDLGPEVFATWLPDPMGQDAYAVILFYDDESKWSMVAHSNRARLQGSGAPKQVLQRTEAAISTPSCSTSREDAPAPEL